MGEVAYIALVPYLSCPCQGTLKNRLIDTNREEDDSLFFTLLRQSSLHFVFYPSTCYRPLRQDEEELIMEMNCLINARADPRTPFQVLRGKPTAHVIAL